MSGNLSCVGAGRPEPKPVRGSAVVIAVLIILIALCSVTLPWQDMLVAFLAEVAAAVTLTALHVWRTNGPSV